MVGGDSGLDHSGFSYSSSSTWYDNFTDYLTEAGEWEAGPRLPVGLGKHCQVSVGSDVYVLGWYCLR